VVEGEEQNTNGQSRRVAEMGKKNNILINK